MLHNFTADLAASQRIATEPWWRNIYAQAFPDFESMSTPVADLTDQRRGIDRVITLAGGAKIYVDEKVRSKTYKDILLEKWSAEETKTPGWIAKPLYCDYIAYAFLDSKICYMLPFQQLRRAWLQNEKAWTQRFGTKPANNRGYTTICVPVPIAYILQAMNDAMWINFANHDGLPFD